MPQQLATAVENNFTKGLITEFTGLNFPENAATDTDNCAYSVIGDVTRRLGINFETNAVGATVDVSGDKALNTYKWNNAGGAGGTQIIVTQAGVDLRFYIANEATALAPLSNHVLVAGFAISSFVAQGNTLSVGSVECQFADGNGYLFIFHPYCEPVYCTYDPIARVVTPYQINVTIRDFEGMPEPGNPVTARPLNLSPEHLYNLTNQGWVQGSGWAANATNTITVGGTGVTSFIVPAGIAGVTVGDSVVITYQPTGFPSNPALIGNVIFSGAVSSYVGTTLNVNVLTVNPSATGLTLTGFLVQPSNIGFINTWFGALANYPSNSDVWWYFKNSTNVFDPLTTHSNVSFNSGYAPRGHFILNAWVQQKSLVSGVSGLTPTYTSIRPKTGTWFQGRIWYAGLDDAWLATGDNANYSWTENIYFSQIIKGTDQFGNCYQTNDPTSETLFDLLPTDGGIIKIQGCGSVYKLFPIQNALLVFAANGVWYITGSQGIGFTANDYTIVKLSAVPSISSTSFVDVLGIPYFWNEEGIYRVVPAKQGSSLVNNPLHVNPLEVIPITIGTILTFYNSIPVSCKKYARGAYSPIDYVIQWTYNSNASSRYRFDSILNFNTYNEAFYPYSLTLSDNMPSINGIVYVSYPNNSNGPPASFKYLITVKVANSSNYTMTFADESDTNYVDWKSQDNVGVNYISHFTTGYKLRGQAIKKFQPQYIQVYSRTNGETFSYKIQGIWDFSNERNSGRWSTIQQVVSGLNRYDTIYRRHKIRGRGFVLQFKITSTDGMPFDIQGWAVEDTVNAGT